MAGAPRTSRVLGSTTKLFAVVAAGLAGGAHAQPPPESGASAATGPAAAVAEADAPRLAVREALRARIAAAEARLEAIRDEESRNGPHSEALVDEWLALALMYREWGDYVPAQEALEAARQIERINNGLYSLGQLPMLRQLTEIAEGRGDFAAVRELERELLSIVRRHPDDLGTVPVLHDIADAQAAVHARELATPELSISINYAGAPMGDATSPRERARSALRRSQRLYRDAIGVLLRNEQYASRELREIEHKLIRSYYNEYRDDPSGRRSARLYGLGRESHRRLVAYAGLGSPSIEAYARALVRLADWDLLFKRFGLARGQYEEAYTLLVEQDVPRTVIEQIFPAETAVPLPAFLPSPFADDEMPGSIDIALELSRYGKTRNAEVLERDASVGASAADDALKLAGRTRFRPPVAAGDGTQRVRVRYGPHR